MFKAPKFVARMLSTIRKIKIAMPDQTEIDWYHEMSEKHAGISKKFTLKPHFSKLEEHQKEIKCDEESEWYLQMSWKHAFNTDFNE